MSNPSADSMINKIERYLDQTPRQDAAVEGVGPFTVFAGRPGGWSYYARPTLPAAPEIDSAEVTSVLRRQRALGVPQAIEGLSDTAPSLATACRDAGLIVREYPLLVHHDPVAVPVPDGIRIRRLNADDDAVAASQVTASLALGSPGTATGSIGPPERDELLLLREPKADDYLRQQIADGRTVVVVAEDATGVLASGTHHPRGDVTSIDALGTLPTARRQGLGAAVADTLVADAFRRKVTLVLLTATDDDVARIYERVGFVRVATAVTAKPETR